MPLRWKAQRGLVVVGAEQLENSWKTAGKKAIPKGFLLKNIVLWLQNPPLSAGKINLGFVNSSETFGYRFPFTAKLHWDVVFSPP